MNHITLSHRASLSNIEEYKVSYQDNWQNLDDYIKVDANENPHGIENEFKKIIDTELSHLQLNRYPDPTSGRLRRIIGKRLHIDPERVIVGNGSDEILSQIAHAFFGKKVAIPIFSYPVYTHLAKINEMNILEIPVDIEDFSLNTNSLDVFLKGKPDLAFFAFPNNPTGTLYSKELIELLIKNSPNTLFILDEAYYDFCGETFADKLNIYENILILRTLSKAYGLAGLRIGFGITSQTVSAVLQKIKIPYNVSSVSQQIAEKLYLPMQEYVLRMRELVDKERAILGVGLNSISGLIVYPSSANFLFAKLPKWINVEGLKKEMQLRKIQLRYMNYQGIGDYIRFSVGKTNENSKCLSIFKEAIARQQ